MSEREQDQQRFAALMAEMQTLGELPQRQLAELQQARAAGAETVTAALTAQRATKDLASDAQSRLNRLRQHALQLAASAGVQVDTDSGDQSSVPPPTNLAECDRELKAVAADLTSAESSWKWVQRSRQADTTARPVTPVGPVSNTEVSALAPAERRSGLDRSQLIWAVFGILLVFIVLAAIFLR